MMQNELFHFSFLLNFHFSVLKYTHPYYTRSGRFLQDKTLLFASLKPKKPLNPSKKPLFHYNVVPGPLNVDDISHFIFINCFRLIPGAQVNDYLLRPLRGGNYKNSTQETGDRRQEKLNIPLRGTLRHNIEHRMQKIKMQN